MMAAVSAAARHRQNGPVSMPGSALGKITRAIVCDLVAPRASEASRYVSGTLRNASSAVPIITGKVRTAG